MILRDASNSGYSRAASDEAIMSNILSLQKGRGGQIACINSRLRHKTTTAQHYFRYHYTKIYTPVTMVSATFKNRQCASMR
jgi:hypothetical protein